jgi:hypothetical protein
MLTYKMLSCLTDKEVHESTRKEAELIQEALMPFLMAIRLAGKEVPEFVGIDKSDYSITYWADIGTGFLTIRVIPFMEWLFFKRYRIKCYSTGVTSEVTKASDATTKGIPLNKLPEHFIKIYEALEYHRLINIK